MINDSDITRAITKFSAYKIMIIQLDKFAYSDTMDMILQVGRSIID